MTLQFSGKPTKRSCLGYWLWLNRFASTAAVERIFSTVDYILSPRRLRTSDFNFENLLFANLNRNVLGIASSKKLELDNEKSKSFLTLALTLTRSIFLTLARA